MAAPTQLYPPKKPEPFLSQRSNRIDALPYEPLGASLPAHQRAHWGAIEALYYAARCARDAGELEAEKALRAACGAMHQTFNKAYPEALRAMAEQILRQAESATSRHQ